MSLTAFLSLKAADTAVKLIIGVVALGRTDGLGLDFAGKAIGLLKDAGSLDEAIRGMDMTDTATRLARQTKEGADAWARSPEHSPHADAAVADFREGLPYCIPDAADIVGQSLDAGAIQSLMLARLRADDCPLRTSFAAGSPGTLFFLHVTGPILSELTTSPEFFDKLTPELWRDLHDRLSAIKSDTGALRAGQARQDAALEEILRHVKRPDAVTEAALIELARRVAGEVQDVDTAVRELERAVQIAERVQAESRAGSNLGAFVDEVLRRMAELSAAGEYDAAAAEIDAALAREEAESRARLLRLLDAGLEQDILRRNPESAARRLARKTELELPEGESLFKALLSVRREWYERGRDLALNFDLELAIALARLACGHGRNPDQRGDALNALGLALQELGSREPDSARLNEALAAYRQALEEWPRQRKPRNWAMVQMNLGIALWSLGEREPRTDRLEEAVRSYRSALEIQSREALPLDWALTQMNLGNALAAIGERESGSKRLEEAIVAYRLALTVLTRERAPSDWALTNMHLGVALKTLGEREARTDRLEEAVKVLRFALKEVTREKLPHMWAGTQLNLGNALVRLGEREVGTARLTEGLSAYRLALDVMTRERTPLDWARLQWAIGMALVEIGRRDVGTASFDEAAAAYRLALEVFSRGQFPLEWAHVQGNLGYVELAFFDKTGDLGHLGASERYLTAARKVFEETGATQYLAMADRQAAEIAKRRGG